MCLNSQVQLSPGCIVKNCFNCKRKKSQGRISSPLATAGQTSAAWKEFTVGSKILQWQLQENIKTLWLRKTVGSTAFYPWRQKAGLETC